MTVLTISRLLDRPKSVGKDTLSLEQLVTKVDPNKYPSLRAALNQKLLTLKTRCQPFREIRNRRLAHNDLHTALKFNSDPLPGISKDDIEESLAMIRDIMNSIWVEFFPDSELGYENPILPNDGEAVIAALKRSKKYRESRRLGR